MTPITHVSRLRHYMTLNISETAKDTAIVVARGGAPIGAGGVMTPTFRGKGGRGDMI